MEPYEKPVPRGSTIVLAREERWHDLKKKRHTLWIWKALDRETGQRLDWECGRRQKATLKKMKKLGLQNFQVTSPGQSVEATPPSMSATWTSL
jgi:IS1 family transposase